VEELRAVVNKWVDHLAFPCCCFCFLCPTFRYRPLLNNRAPGVEYPSLVQYGARSKRTRSYPVSAYSIPLHLPACSLDLTWILYTVRYITGTPDLLLTFTNPHVLTDCAFHPCVRCVLSQCIHPLIINALTWTLYLCIVAYNDGPATKLYHSYPPTDTSHWSIIDMHLRRLHLGSLALGFLARKASSSQCPLRSKLR